MAGLANSRIQTRSCRISACVNTASILALFLLIPTGLITHAQNHDAEQSIRTIRVTGDRDYPPYCYLDNGIPTGFDIDIVRAVAVALNIQLEIELKTWSEARHRLETGRADIIPGMARIALRETDIEFSTPIKQLSFDLFVPVGSPIKSLDDARHASILVQKAGVMYDMIKSEGIITNLIPVVDAPEAIKLLAAGKYDGAIVNRTQGHYLLVKNKIQGIQPRGIAFPTIPYCFAARKGEAELIYQINEGLNIIKADGQYGEIYSKWFGLYEPAKTHQLVRYLLAGASLVFLLMIVLGIINRSLRKTIQRRTEEMRLIIDLIPHPIFARDREGRYILVNQAMADNMGMSIEDITGRKQTELHPDKELSASYLNEDRKVMESRTSLIIPDTAFVDWNGISRTMQVSKIPFQIKDGRVHSVLCVAVDVTDLIAAERSAQISRDNLAITLNSIADGVIATDGDGVITRMNPAAEIITDYPMNEAVGQPTSAILNLFTSTGEKQSIEHLKPNTRGDNEKADLLQQLVLVSKSGMQRDISLNWSLIIDSKGLTSGMVLILRDVTEENRLHQQLTETQKMESIGRLAGGVAHDFNNLLTGIMGYTELLNINLKEHDECRIYLKGILEASERARDLVQQLLTFSRKNPREIKPVNMHTVIGHVISLLQHTMDRRISVSRHLSAVCMDVMGDRSQLQNALLNLGVNARDAMPSGGSLTVTTRNVTLDAIQCARYPYPIVPGLYFELTLTDTGTGMDRETITHIFEPFFTTKGKMGGTGLGLAAVYGTVKDHGGFIDVTSKPGQGTTFRIGFPAHYAKSSAVEEVNEPHTANGTGCIMIVDDEYIVAKTISELLRSLGYSTLTAVNGRDALSVYERNRDQIDLVVLDMIMPELNGEETFRELKRLNPDIKVMMCSGYIQDFRVEELLKLGILDFLHKPFLKNELATRVASILKTVE